MTRSKTAILTGALLMLTVLSLLAWPGAARASIIEQVSLTTVDGHPIGNCGAGALSGDGRYVAFYTMASDVVPGDTNGVGDIFVRDTVNGTSERVSVSSAEVEGNGWSIGSFVSADGRYVAFGSDATNLGGGGDTNGDYDVFVRDRTLGTTTQVSVSTGLVKGNAASHICSLTQLLDDVWIPAVVAARPDFVHLGIDERTFLPGDGLMSDTFHPNRAGYVRTAEEWNAVLEQWFCR